jgi:hypothetical protein
LAVSVSVALGVAGAMAGALADGAVLATTRAGAVCSGPHTAVLSHGVTVKDQLSPLVVALAGTVLRLL